MKTLAGSAAPPRLSVAMIVRDEQDVLAPSIESVRGIADEIVVLDTGSLDRTPELAAELGATVHHKAWENDFAATRNYCLRRVSGNWVLWLDAGEQIDAECAAGLRSFLASEADSATAYTLVVQIPPRDPGASAEQIEQYRLLPNRLDLRFAGRVRETVEESIAVAGLARSQAPGRIVRDPRQHDPDRLLVKAQRDLALATAEAETTGNWLPRLLLAAGQAQSILGRQEEARDMLRRAIKMSPAASSQRLEAYYALLTTFDDDPQAHASQLSACLDSLQDFPFDLQLLLALGNYMLVRERLDLAIRAFEAAVGFGRITPTVWHLCEAREIAAVCLSLALQARQRDEDARNALEAALAEQPNSLRLANQLQILYHKQGKTAEAAALVARLPADVQVRSGSPQAGSDSRSLRVDAGRSEPVFSPHLDVLQATSSEG